MSIGQKAKDQIRDNTTLLELDIKSSMSMTIYILSSINRNFQLESKKGFSDY